MLIEDIKTAFPDIKIPDLQNYYADVIGTCRDVFGGEPHWKVTKKSGLYSSGTRNMSLLNVSKVLCDEFAKLTFSEKTGINISDASVQKYVDSVLKDNGFYKNMTDFLARAYALGGGVIKCYAADGKAVLDFLRADQFVPTEFNNRRITGGVFRSVTYDGKFYYTLFEKYSAGTVEYKLFRSGDKVNIGSECPLSELYGGLAPFVDYGTDIPMFAYFRPAVTNNLGDNVLGLSVFANSLDTLKSLDVAFDSFSREFILGKKRIIVPSSCIRTVVDTESGVKKKYFDADDEVYQALRCDEEQDLKVVDNTMEIRVSEHVDSINALLNILCFQTGLSAGHLSFDAAGGLKTATEIISENSKTFRTAKDHKNLLEEFLIDVVYAISSVGNYLGLCPLLSEDAEVTVSFADNIVEDDNTIIDNNIKLVQAGLKSKLSAVMEIMKCDEAEARKELEKVSEEQAQVVDDGTFDASEDGENI